MKAAWIILLISAVTDFVINTGSSLMAAMVATGSAVMPMKAVVVLAVVGGLVQMSRTIQQALKSDQLPAGQLLPPSQSVTPPQQQ